MQPTDLAWTGERFVPSVTGETSLEHLHRYALAKLLARGKRVLDVACGEGYGSQMLAENASSVIGIDVAPEAVIHAREKYKSPNLEFKQGNCIELPLADASIDLIVSFETLEHHAEHDAMLAELRRVLTEDGVLLLSTPNRLYYSDERHYANPFHVRELYADEFRQLIFNHFPNAAFYSQRVAYASFVAPDRGAAHFVSYSTERSGIVQDSGVAAPFYMLGVASAGSLPSLPSSVFDGTREWQQHAEILLKELAESNDQLARTRLHLEAVHASIYWRLSYPLRLLRKAVRLIFGV